MVKYALLNEAQDTVENVILLDDEDATEWDGKRVVKLQPKSGVGPGHNYDGENFVPPLSEAAPAPETPIEEDEASQAETSRP